MVQQGVEEFRVGTAGSGGVHDGCSREWKSTGLVQHGVEEYMMGAAGSGGVHDGCSRVWRST